MKLQVENNLSNEDLLGEFLPNTSLAQLEAAFSPENGFAMGEGHLKISHAGGKNDSNSNAIDIRWESAARNAKGRADYEIEIGLAKKTDGKNVIELKRCYNHTGVKRTGFGKKSLALVADLALANNYAELDVGAVDDGVLAWPAMGATLNPIDVQEIADYFSNIRIGNVNERVQRNFLSNIDFMCGRLGGFLKHENGYEHLAHEGLIRSARLRSNGLTVPMFFDQVTLQNRSDEVYPNGGPFSKLEDNIAETEPVPYEPVQIKRALQVKRLAC